ncbi:AIPR family protein [Brucella sp. 2716]|uniref:AIPR family protein n=1 Tax=Brucella sp. 2716 TaxID=2975052 RepID=UPI00217D833E|nr:AIPR family protein [Brucella sp. 2716]UWF60768.1 AIPR family protein [Brucella sp. 2716]
MDSVTQALIKDFAESNSLTGLSVDKQVEHFAAYSIVSSRYTEDFDTTDLVVGDGQDLNVDAFAVKVNGRLANDADYIDDVLGLNGYLDAEFIIIQAKSSSSFDGAAIIALGDNLVNEVFSANQKLPVNDEVKRLIEIKERILQNASRLKDNPVCRVYYVCTGNWTDDAYLVEAIKRKRQDLLDTNLFSEVTFEPIGARQLQALYRATKTSIAREVKFEKLITLPSIDGVSASYLGVLPVKEFLKLLTDDSGDIIKSVFVDNVRDFQGENPVNADIAKTITDGLFDQFVLRNNGITIVSRNIKVTSNQYLLEDYQIVNGCQTSHVIFSHQNEIAGELFVPVKLIHTISEDVAQSIIKSTNKQTNVEENDLLALTQFQRDLEDYYTGIQGDTKLYYERRAKQYASNATIEKGRIVTIGNQLKCYASMFLDSANQASRYQGTLLKTVKDRIFQPTHKPEPYFVSALAAYRFEIALRKLTNEERDIRPFKYFLLFAFRSRYELEDFPGAGNKRVPGYCKALEVHLADNTSAKIAFDEAVLIVREALEKLGLPVVRDSAKSRPLVEEVKKTAIARRSVESGTVQYSDG